jgi:glycogen synthase
LRILLLSWEFPPHLIGGLGRHVAELAPALGEQGVEVHVITPRLSAGAEQEQIAERVTVHRVPLEIGEDDNLVASSRLANAALERKAHQLSAALGGFDLIHGHDWLVAYASVALKYSLRLPLVVTVHSMERGRLQGNLQSEQSLAIHGTEWWLTYESWRVITVSQYMARQAHDHFGVPHDKLEVIPNGVTPPATPPLPAAERAAFRSEFADPYEPIALYVGRIVYEKGVHVLVDAAPRILRDVPNMRFVVAGTGAYLNDVRERAFGIGVGDRFSFPGFIADEVRDKLYQVADVAVFPSLYEPFGIVALEAMALGCPVVVSRTGGLSEFVQPHETGIHVTPGDAESLAWGVLHTIQHPEWTDRRVQNARADVAQNYTWARIAQQTIAAYRRTRETWQRAGGNRPSTQRAAV